MTELFNLAAIFTQSAFLPEPIYNTRTIHHSGGSGGQRAAGKHAGIGSLSRSSVFVFRNVADAVELIALHDLARALLARAMEHGVPSLRSPSL